MILNNHYSFYEALEKEAVEMPDDVAVVFQDRYDGLRTITHSQLKEKVDRLSDSLKREGVKTGDIIGVMTEGTIETVINLFSVIKSGGLYLPIDPGNSNSRIISQLGDYGASMLLTAVGEIQKTSPQPHSTSRLIKLNPFITPRQSQITELDKLPFPDRSLVNYEKYMQQMGQSMFKNYIAVQATRGCPYKCVYCHKIWPKNHVFRSAENIFAEIKLYYDMGVRRFSFIDDVFNLNIKNSSRFFELIIKNGLKVQFLFPAGLRGDILTRKFIDLMVEAGTVQVSLALETASPRLQKLIGKNLNIEKLRENMIYISEKYPHIILDLFTMNGFPTETKEEALGNLEFIKSIKWIHFPYLFIVKVFPNTDLEKLALDHGITKETIARSETLAYHDIPDTLPYEKSFMLQYKSDFLQCFLSKERLLNVLPYQMKILSEEELVLKYSIYLPISIKHFSDFLEFVGITYEELGMKECADERVWEVPNLHEKMKKHFGEKESDENALRILLLDLTQLFSNESYLLFDLAEAPIGLMYLLTYLNHHLGSKVRGKIARSHIDFDSYDQLKQIIDQFKPEVIGIRAMTIYKDFFHKTVAQIRQWGITTPIITGGPYATSDYHVILQDSQVDLVVLGEGEVTFSRLISEIIENDRRLPGEEVLKKLPGLAFIPESEKARKKSTNETEKLNESIEHILKEITKTEILNLTEINKISDDEKKQIFEFNFEKGEENYDF